MIHSYYHKQYLQQFNSRYIVPQHKKPRKNQTQREMMDKRLKQNNNEQLMTLNGKSLAKQNAKSASKIDPEKLPKHHHLDPKQHQISPQDNSKSKMQSAHNNCITKYLHRIQNAPKKSRKCG